MMNKPVPKRIGRRGRNRELIRLRNDALCRRFVYWSEIKRLRMDDVLMKLSREEFFIDEKRILHIIRENADRINHFRNEGSTKQLRMFD